MQALLWLYWNPDRVLFTAPIIDRPIAWYGFWFVFGFAVGYFLMAAMFRERLNHRSILSAKDQAYYLTDRLTWYVILGVIVGSRLAHVLFYEWPRYQNHLFDIVKIWEGGLASHGGVIGLLIGLFAYKQIVLKPYPQITYLGMMDMLAVPSALVATCVRIGNFFNQEILGVPSTVPWAVVFGDPIDGGPIVPRHPAQLYEGAAYFVIFWLLIYLWKRKAGLARPGLLSGLILLLIFSSRILIEFIKMPQSMMFDESYIQTGQILSLPFVAVGAFLVFYGPSLERKRSKS